MRSGVLCSTFNKTWRRQQHECSSTSLDGHDWMMHLKWRERIVLPTVPGHVAKSKVGGEAHSYISHFPMLRSTLLRLPRASSSRSVRSLSSSAPLRRDILSEFEEQITPRELVERKRKEFEAKYADKLKSKIEA